MFIISPVGHILAYMEAWPLFLFYLCTVCPKGEQEQSHKLIKTRMQMPSMSLQEELTCNPWMELSGSKHTLKLYMDHVYSHVVIILEEETLWFHCRH